MEVEEHHVILNRVFHVVPGKGVGVLAHQLHRVGTRLLRRDFAGNTLLRYILRTNAHGQALAKGTGLEEVGNADLYCRRTGTQTRAGSTRPQGI